MTNVRQNVEHIEGQVQQKVKEALQFERKKMRELELDNKTLNDKLTATDSQLRDMENEGQQYQDKIINLQQQLEFMGANSGDPNALKKFEPLA